MTLPSFSLEGKTCVVTGAARGLGKEFLTAFASSGAKGACIDLSLPAANSAVKAIRDHVDQISGIHLNVPAEDVKSSPRPDLKGYACDVTSESAVKATFSSILNDFGKIDVVVTAAGMVENFQAEKYEYDRWKSMLDVNLNGTWLWAREAGKYWLEKGLKGNFIAVSSISSLICVKPQKQVAYNASKAAVSMMVKSLCTEWAPHGIRVNAISPGYMKTDLIIELLEKEGKHMEEDWIKDIPMGRMAHPSELQGTIVWMASDASSYLNGSDIVVDGGYTCY